MLLVPRKSFTVESPRFAYKWARNWGRIQLGFFEQPVALRRERQILDFAVLNGFNKVYFETDTDVFALVPGIEKCSTIDQADIVVVTDQRFSRYTCTELVLQIRQRLQQCQNLYICLNRHYINIDNSMVDQSLDNNFNRAITQWLTRELPEAVLVDMSLDYVDAGDWFTWVIPDRHYFIRLKQ